MNLFLLSKTDNLNTELRLALSQEINNYDHKIAYISSAKQTEEKKYYLTTIKDFKKVNDECVLDYFDLSSDFTDDDLEKLKKYKIIYLSGGNTFDFLKDSKERNLREILKSVLNNSLIIGASAGAIMMTPQINISYICDSNDVNLQDLSSFKFVSFEFHPHFKEEDLGWLQNYKSNDSVYKILACKDGDGVQYKDNAITLFGKVNLL
jgi:dipeptidase E